MGKLSEKDAKELERLQRLKEAPDPEPIGKSVHFTVDLGKKDQIELARTLGLIQSDEPSSEGDVDEEGGGEPDKGRKPDRAPKRGGYFDS